MSIRGKPLDNLREHRRRLAVPVDYSITSRSEFRSTTSAAISCSSCWREPRLGYGAGAPSEFANAWLPCSVKRYAYVLSSSAHDDRRRSERRPPRSDMPFRVPRMATSDLTEIGGLLRSRLQHLREQERRNQRGRGKRSRTARGRARLRAIEAPPPDETLLSSTEVARLLNVTPKTVWRWATQDGLPSVRTGGGHRRYRWAAVRQWMSS